MDLVAKGDRERLTAFLRKAPRTVREGLRKAPRAVRGDLWTVARDPLPSVGLLGWLPHVHVMLFVAIMGLLNANQSRQVLGEASALWTLIVVLQPAAALLALSRPVPAWWLSTIGLSATAAAAETGADRDTLWPWSVAGIALHTLVLLLLALRVRPRVAVEALGLTVLAGLLNTSLASQNHNQVLTRGAVIFATAVVVGTALRGRRVARTRLVRQEELTAEERSRRTLLEERNRIARELHDVVAHHMSVISIQAQVAPHLVDAPTAELTENLAGIRESAVEALTELRRVLGVLRSEDAGAEGVRHAPQPTLDRLDEVVAKVRGAGLTVTTETTGAPRPLSPGVELSAFRIVQEALSNVLRHAPGAAVRVAIGYRPDGLILRIANTAPREPVPLPPDTGHGLLGMRERTAMLGGELATGCTPDGGWEVTAILPATAPKPPADPVEARP
ncbi:sensor histidine kinase [Streptomyces celluloflavus]|uniref:sensor histidine kinase n=1 Tax=Streptomyces celluloflavus TaxID=58344 RepID=UPI0034600B20|nr:sensor histidine kinase [Streptomyces celluloflavus]